MATQGGRARGSNGLTTTNAPGPRPMWKGAVTFRAS